MRTQVCLFLVLTFSGGVAFSPNSSFQPFARFRAPERRFRGRCALLYGRAPGNSAPRRMLRAVDGDRMLKMTEAGLFAPFWEHTVEVLKELDGISSYPIPEGFLVREDDISAKANNGATPGPAMPSVARTETFAFQTPKLRQIRCAYINRGAAIGFAIFPHANYDLPFLGIDLVSVPSGHLVALDIQPLFPTDAYREKYYGRSPRSAPRGPSRMRGRPLQRSRLPPQGRSCLRCTRGMQRSSPGGQTSTRTRAPSSPRRSSGRARRTATRCARPRAPPPWAPTLRRS
jgi:hypothetical protein